MRKQKFLSLTFIFLAFFIGVVYVSCTKEKTDPCSGVACLNGGACNAGTCICPTGYTGSHCETTIVTNPCAGVTCLNGGYCSSGTCICPTGYTGTYCETPTGGGSNSITYHNNTYTPITITVNGSTATIPVAGNKTFTGSSGNSATGTASTSGETTSGTQVGLLITWTISNTFSSSAQTVNLDINSSYFFLKLINSSAYTINKVYVNYGLTSQTLDNISVANSGTLFGIGYYKAWTNSNLYLMSGSIFWSYNISLSFTSNQSYTFTAI